MIIKAKHLNVGKQFFYEANSAITFFITNQLYRFTIKIELNFKGN